MQLLFSARQTIATLVKYKCKTVIKLTPGLTADVSSFSDDDMGMKTKQTTIMKMPTGHCQVQRI